jgi:hypothetical protein
VGEALVHVIDTLNVTSSRVIAFKTPHELLFGEKPEVSHLRTWGCAVYVFVPRENRKHKKKLKTELQPGILLGYSSTTKGYKWMHARTGDIGTARGDNMAFKERFTIASSFVEKVLGTRS